MKTLNVSSVYGVPYESSIVKPVGDRNVRRMVALKKPEELVLHSTANTAKSASAKLHGRYLDNLEKGDKEYKSWHFTVDELEIVQHLPLDEPGYHAGDGNGKGNSNGIAIEICENGNYKKAQQNAMRLLIYLKDILGVPYNLIKPHNYYSGKLCPRNIIKSDKTRYTDWNKFISELKELEKEIKHLKVPSQSKPTKPKKPVKVPTMESNVSYKTGMKVKVSKNATKWSTGEPIPSWVKGEVYEIMQVKSDKLLLKGVLSWINKKDVRGV